MVAVINISFQSSVIIVLFALILLLRFNSVGTCQTEYRVSYYHTYKHVIDVGQSIMCIYVINRSKCSLIARRLSIILFYSLVRLDHISWCVDL